MQSPFLYVTKKVEEPKKSPRPTQHAASYACAASGLRIRLLQLGCVVWSSRQTAEAFSDRLDFVCSSELVAHHACARHDFVDELADIMVFKLLDRSFAKKFSDLNLLRTDLDNSMLAIFRKNPEFAYTRHAEPFAVARPRCLPRAVRIFATPMRASSELQTPNTNKLIRAASGIAFCTSGVLVTFGIYPAILSAWVCSILFDSERHRANDFLVQWWARLLLTFAGADVRVEGVENLPPADEPVLYAPNHCSSLDSIVLLGYMPRRFKYISNAETTQTPFIGWAMQMAKHIALDRGNLGSEFQTLKDAIKTLKTGSSLVVFPEGTRSKDGRLMDFKRGITAIAFRAGVRIVPLTIIGTHIFQPVGAWTPYAPPRGIRIVIHEAIDAPVRKPSKYTDDALSATKAAVESVLPNGMKPLQPVR